MCTQCNHTHTHTHTHFQVTLDMSRWNTNILDRTYRGLYKCTWGGGVGGVQQVNKGCHKLLPRKYSCTTVPHRGSTTT